MPGRSSPVGGRDSTMPAHFGIFPEAEVQLLDGGHLLLETNLDEFVPVVRDFLGRAHPPAPMPQSLS